MPKNICNGAQNKGFFGADAVTIGMQIGGKKMARYTDAEKLYERFAGLEAQALAEVEELNKIPLEEMTKEEYVEWRVWSAILRERSAFKHDVFDAPTADVRKVRHGKWLLRESDGYTRDFYYCSRCKGEALQDGDGDDVLSRYCPHCGARMAKGKDGGVR